MRSELFILLKVYAVILCVIFLIFGVSAGILSARNNTRRTSFGEKTEIARYDNLF